MISQEQNFNVDQYVPQAEESQKTQVQGNRVKFAKLLQDEWEKLERRNFNQFELRVLDSLQQLGNNYASKVIEVDNEEFSKQQTKISEKKAPKEKKVAKKGGKQQEEEEETKQSKEISVSRVLEICVGEQLYTMIIRPELVKFKLLAPPKKDQEEDDEDEDDEEEGKKQKKDTKDKKKKTKTAKKGSKNAPKKEDEMKIQMAKDRVASSVLSLLNMMVINQNAEIKLFEEEFLKVEQAAKRIKSLKWLELKFVALMVYADQLIKCHLESKIREEYAIELIYFLKNVYIKYRHYNGQSFLDSNKTEEVSQTVMKDVRKKLEKLHSNFSFSNRLLFNKYPRLVIDTDLNQSFSQTDIKPYKSQEEIIESLSNLKKPTLIFLNTMVGTGKTVLSVAITQFLQKLRDGSLQLPEDSKSKFAERNMIFATDLKKLQILYCCPLANVRTQVGSAAYVKNLKFGIASMWKRSNTNENATQEEKELGFHECPRIVNSWQNKSEEYPTLIIADFKTTYELLQEKETLISDEKTVIRWQGNKQQTLTHNPSKNGNQYILFIDEPTVDADFPNAETTSLLVQIMRHAPPITILSSATLPSPEKLPTFLKLFQRRYGDIDLKQIHSQQFQIGCQIFCHDGRKFLPHYKVQNKEQLQIVLNRLKDNPFMQRCYNANAYCELHDRMKQNGIKDLEDFESFNLITQEIVQEKSIALLNKLLNESDEIILKICKQFLPNEDADDIPLEKNDDKIMFSAPYKKLVIQDLVGKLAHKFIGGCLIAVNSPMQLVREKMFRLIKKAEPAHIYIKQYEKNYEILEKMKEKKEKEIDDPDERSKQIQALEESMNISIAFPDKMKINTLEHYRKFIAKNDTQLLNRYRARKAFSLEAINYGLDIPDDIMLFLFAGIACYSEKKTELISEYYEEVQNLASNGQLAFIVSDDSMCYGVNYPLNHVIVFDEMAEQRSMGALFQLIGRAGRVGVSWVANAYLEQKTFDRLVNYLEGKESDEEKRDEAYNMELLAKELIEDIIRKGKERKRLEQEKKEQEEK